MDNSAEFILPELAQKKPVLSLGAIALLEMLESLSANQGYAFPSQEWLATEFGRTVRTIRRWLNELHLHGKISWDRTGRRNNYRLTDSGQKCPIRPDKNVRYCFHRI